MNTYVTIIHNSNRPDTTISGDTVRVSGLNEIIVSRDGVDVFVTRSWRSLTMTCK